MHKLSDECCLASAALPQENHLKQVSHRPRNRLNTELNQRQTRPKRLVALCDRTGRAALEDELPPVPWECSRKKTLESMFVSTRSALFGLEGAAAVTFSSDMEGSALIATLGNRS